MYEVSYKHIRLNDTSKHIRLNDVRYTIYLYISSDNRSAVTHFSPFLCY